MKIPFIDIHTHHSLNSEEVISVSNLFLQDIDNQNDIPVPFSTAIHPWHSEKYTEKEVYGMLENVISQPGLIAIGETGLDRLCSADYQLQHMLFRLHLEFAEKNHKPIIIHAVRSWNELIPYLKKIKVPVILHGYSGRPELTKQLIPLGCYFSIGKTLLNSSPQVREVIRLIPMTSLFLETDDSQADIREIYRMATILLEISLDELKIKINKNYFKIKEKLF